MLKKYGKDKSQCENCTWGHCNARCKNFDKEAYKFEKIKTWLPVFHGFYGSGLEDDNDLEYTLFDNPDNDSLNEDHKQWICDEAFDYIDYSGYHLALSKAICEGVCEELASHELIKSYEFEALISPKYYNFRNDHIDVEVEVDINKLIDLCEEQHEEFAEYLKEHYTSYDGFISSYSNDLNDWFGLLDGRTDGLIHNDTAHCVGAVLNFLLSGKDQFDCGYQDIICEAAGEVYISEYIDYDKLIYDFNEEFGTNAKSLDEIEQGVPTNPEDVRKKDCIGQSFFEFKN